MAVVSRPGVAENTSASRLSAFPRLGSAKIALRRGPVEGGTRSRVRSLSASMKAATACSRRSVPLSRLPRFKRAPPRAWWS